MLFICFRIGLSILLALTAAFKLFDTATILGSGGLLASPLRLSVAVGFEVFAAVVISLAPPRVGHRFALLVFSSLACIAAWAWWTQTDCGCFGSRTPIGVPLFVDVVAIALLLACSHSASKRELSEKSAIRLRLFWLSMAALVGMLASGATLWRMEQLTHEVEMPAWFGDNMIGNQFPLLHDEKFAAVMPATGDAIVVMLRPDCEHCHEVAAGWGSSGIGRPDTLQVVSISVVDGRWTVMPNDVSPTPMGADDEFLISWEDKEDPFVSAPTLVAIHDRVVVGVATGNMASELIHEDEWIQKLFENDVD